MQDTLITMDVGLSARLQACRQLFLRLDAGTAEEWSVRLPEGDTAPLGMGRGKGLRAAGALLSYALLGREEADALNVMDALSQDHPERSLRKVCQMATDMLREEPAFSQASLYAALRTAVVFLPEAGAASELPGLIRGNESAGAAPDRPAAVLSARYAFADNAAIAYFDLPDGVEEARIGEGTYTRAQCHAGVCLPPDTKEITVEWTGSSASLRPADPMDGLRLTVGFRRGKWFIPARRFPKRLWEKRTPCVRALGKPGSLVPAMTLVTSVGTIQVAAVPLPKGEAFLRCPPLDPRKDVCVELQLPAARYLDINGEDE